MGQTIELPDVLSSAMDVVLQGVWTSLPGRIESYDPATQTATVAAGVKDGFVGEDGERVVHDIPVFNSVPVLHLGGGSFRTVYPVSPGDYVLLVILSRSRDGWQTRGGVGVDGGDDRRHHLSDAVAITGLRPHTSALASAPTDRMSVGSDLGASIEIYDDEVRVGGNVGTEPTIRATTYRAAEDVYFSALNVMIADLATCIATLSTAVPLLTGPSPAVDAFASAVSALGIVAGDFAGVVTTFNSAASTYKSTVAKVL